MARILLAEDDDNICGIVSSILERQGHQVTETTNGNEALAATQEAEFDLVVTDIMMPGKGGLGLISDLKKTLPDLKILAASAGGRLDSTYYLREARELGADETLMKPFSKEELLEAIGKLLPLGQTP